VILALRRPPYFFDTVPLVLSRLLPATGLNDGVESHNESYSFLILLLLDLVTESDPRWLNPHSS
jgi:hypothetical protein